MGWWSVYYKKDISDGFASYFDTKIKKPMDETSIDVNIYNVKKLVTCTEWMFMSCEDIRECIISLKPKNSE
jgi:hypothetical protein